MQPIDLAEQIAAHHLCPLLSTGSQSRGSHRKHVRLFPCLTLALQLRHKQFKELFEIKQTYPFFPPSLRQC